MSRTILEIDGRRRPARPETLAARTDRFGYGNYTGIGAMLAVARFLALSNSYSPATQGA